MACLQRTRVLDEIDDRFSRSPELLPAVFDRPLAEIRGSMLDPEVELAVKDSIWREVLRKAEDSAEWQLAALWLMVPGLRKIVARWSGRPWLDLRDLESEAVTAFFGAVRDVDVEREAIGARIWWAVRRQVHQAAERTRRELPVDDIELTAATHGSIQDVGVDPLAEAVRQGVISAAEAGLINRTRIEGERLGSVAERLGLRYHACQRRRSRAEGRLAGYLQVERVPAVGPKAA